MRICLLVEICCVNRSQTCFNRAPVPGTYKSVRTGGEGGGWGEEVLSSGMVIYNVSSKKKKKKRTGKGRVLDSSSVFNSIICFLCAMWNYYMRRLKVECDYSFDKTLKNREYRKG